MFHLIQVSPLLLATQRGHLKVVKVLLDHPRIDVTLTNEVGYNALAEAIVKGYRQVITVLKESMHFIYIILYSDIALEIINSDHWDKAMRMCNANNITPMRLLIEFMPGNLPMSTNMYICMHSFVVSHNYIRHKVYGILANLYIISVMK